MAPLLDEAWDLKWKIVSTYSRGTNDLKAKVHLMIDMAFDGDSNINPLMMMSLLYDLEHMWLEVK